MGPPQKRSIGQRLEDWYTTKPMTYAGTLDRPSQSPRQNTQDVMKAATQASLPFLGYGLATAPLATGLGLAGGVGGSVLGSQAGGYLGGKLDAPSLGSDIGGATGGFTGGAIGSSVGAPPEAGNWLASLLRNPATARQSQLGRAGTVKSILPAFLQKWTVPEGLIPKGELGTPTNPGPFNEIPSKLPAQLRGDPFNPTSPPDTSPFPRPLRPLVGTPEDWAAYQQQMDILKPEAQDAGTYHAARGSASRKVNLQQRIGKRMQE